MHKKYCTNATVCFIKVKESTLCCLFDAKPSRKFSLRRLPLTNTCIVWLCIRGYLSHTKIKGKNNTCVLNKLNKFVIF